MIWDTAKTKEPIKRIDIQSFVGYEIAWSNNEDFLFVSALGGKIVALDSKNFNVACVERFSAEDDLKVEACTANWKTLPGKVLCGSGKGHITWYNCVDGKLKKEKEFLAHLDGCRNLNLHPHEKFLLSTGKDSSARMWNCSS